MNNQHDIPQPFDEHFVDSVYRGVLGRVPAEREIREHLDRLHAGTSWKQLLEEIALSSEFRAKYGNSHWLGLLEADVTILLHACIPMFGKVRLQGPMSDLSVFANVINNGGIWEPHITTLLHHLLRPGDTFVDVGANLGYFTVLASSRVGDRGHVIAFEPLSRARRYCMESLRINNCANVSLHPYALWNMWEEKKLATGLWMGGSHLTPETSNENAEQDSELVECAALDALTADGTINLPTCQVIKMDIEGAEVAALQGMKRTIERTRPILVFEVNSYCLAELGEAAQTLLERISRYGYHVMAMPTSDQTPAFVHIPSASPWEDVDIRGPITAPELAILVEKLDESRSPAFPLDAVAFPSEVTMATIAAGRRALMPLGSSRLPT